MTIPLTLNAGTVTNLAGMEWTLSYNATDIVSISVSPGSAATAAGKSLSCTGGSGTYTCILSGINSTPLATGVIANAALQLSSTTTSLSSSIQVGNAMAVDLTGASVGASGNSSTIGIAGSLLPVPANLSCSPSSLTPSTSSTCTVTISSAAPSGGASVALASNNANLTVPASVAVAAGSASATFLAKAGAFTAASSATVTATLNSASVSTSLSLTTSSTVPVPANLSCSPSSLSPSTSSTCTVTISSAAPSGGASVALASNTANLTVPASVAVAAGSTSATFTAKAGAFTAASSATVTATLNSASVSTSLSLTTSSTVPVPSKLSCSPSSLTPSTSSTCTVTISSAASSDGAIVALASNNANLTVPTSIKVPAGGTSTTFTATAGAFTAAATATVTASLHNTSVTTTISLASLSISSLACSPTSLSTQQTSTCTVKLSAAAPTGGSSVKVTNNSTLITVPASVTVAAAATSATFSAAAGSILATGSAIVTTTLGTSSVNATIALAPSLFVSAVNCAPSSLSSQQSGTCTVTLTAAAPSGGTTVTLADNSSALTTPASVTVPAGATTAPATITAGTISADSSAVVTATLSGKSSTASVNLVATRLVKSLACSPSSLSYNQSSTCTATLNMAAPAGGSLVTLSDNSASLTEPASVTVAAGASTATFAATAGVLTASSSASVTAALNGTSQSAAISLVPPVIPSTLACSPVSISSLAQTTCTVTLSKVAPSGGLTVVLGSNSSQLTVPASVAVAASAQSAKFTAKSGTLSANAAATLTSTLNGVSASTTVNLVAPAVPTSVTCNPTVLSGSQQTSCTVALLKAAPTGGTTVTLTSSSSSLTAPTSILVAAGASSGSFAARSAAVSASTTASITAAAYSVSQLAWLTLNPLTGAAASMTAAPQVAPYSGSGTTQTFTLSAPTNAADPTAIFDVLFNSSMVPGNACYVRVNFPYAIIRQMDDSGTVWSNPQPIGTAGTLANSQCAVDGASVSVKIDSQNASAQMTLQFKAGFSGQQNIYTRTFTAHEATSGWQSMGTWSPNTASGTSAGMQLLRDPASQSQMYTSNSGEATMLAARGLEPQGAPFQVYNAPATLDGVAAVPLFRVYNTVQQTHFWTTDYNRYAAMLRGSGYAGEGVDGFVLPQAAGNAVPLYQLQSCCDSNLYRWTADAAERAALLGGGAWVDAGIAAWVLPSSRVSAQAADANSAAPVLTTAADAAAGQRAPFAAGQVIRLYGRNLSGTGATVQVNNAPADVLAVTDDSITVRLPGSAAGSAHTEIALPNGLAGPLSVALTPARPSLFVSSIFGGGQVTANNADGTANTPDHPAAAGSNVTVYLTGLPEAFHSLPLSAFVAGSPAPVKSVSATGKPGVWSVTLTIPPQAVSNTAAPLEIECGFSPTQLGTTIAVR